MSYSFAGSNALTQLLQNLKTKLDAKADSSSLSSLATRVTSAESNISTLQKIDHTQYVATMSLSDKTLVGKNTSGTQVASVDLSTLGGGGSADTTAIENRITTLEGKQHLSTASVSASSGLGTEACAFSGTVQ